MVYTTPTHTHTLYFIFSHFYSINMSFIQSLYSLTSNESYTHSHTHTSHLPIPTLCEPRCVKPTFLFVTRLSSTIYYTVNASRQNRVWEPTPHLYCHSTRGRRNVNFQIDIYELNSTQGQTRLNVSRKHSLHHNFL